MSLSHSQELDLINFTGRIFCLSDSHGHYSLFSQLINAITELHQSQK